MHLQNTIYNEQSSILTAELPFGTENQNGIKPSEQNKAFISIISHNMKNPFGALLGYSELLLEDYSELTDSERKEFVLDIKKTANLTYRYLERFFDWMYYKTDKLKPFFEELNLRKIIGLATKRSLVEQNYLGEINFKIDSYIRIFADFESIVKVFYYVLENSIKYNKTNGLIIINANVVEKFVFVEIIDHGKGISEDRIHKLFDISANIVPNGSDTESGTGMGLILAKQLLTLNRSAIIIESKQEVGTKVVLRIPRSVK